MAKKNNKGVWVVLGILGLLLIGSQANSTPPGGNTPTDDDPSGSGSGGSNAGGGSGAGGSGSGTLDKNVVLQQGSTNTAEVAELQRILNVLRQSNPNYTYNQLAVDGVFGPLTLAAVQNVFGKDTVTLAEAEAALSWTPIIP